VSDSVRGAGEVGTLEGRAGRPDVWVFDRASEHFRKLAELGPVSEEERARAGKLRGPGLGSDLLARRAAVRRVLALYLGRDPESVRIVALPGGKPTLVPALDDTLALSYSSGHSADVFCLAVGAAKSLGVDVEKRRTVSRALPIAMRWFSREESSFLRSAPEERFSEEFLRLWTAKRHSAGLRLMSGGGDELDVHWEEARKHLVHFIPRAGYLAALASTVAIDRIRLVAEPFAHLRVGSR
jgi:phosphopantetheinyl transferase